MGVTGREKRMGREIKIGVVLEQSARRSLIAVYLGSLGMTGFDGFKISNIFNTSLGC